MLGGDEGHWGMLLPECVCVCVCVVYCTCMTMKNYIKKERESVSSQKSVISGLKQLSFVFAISINHPVNVPARVIQPSIHLITHYVRPRQHPFQPAMQLSFQAGLVLFLTHKGALLLSIFPQLLLHKFKLLGFRSLKPEEYFAKWLCPTPTKVCIQRYH